jgi:hypothetical protein
MHGYIEMIECGCLHKHVTCERVVAESRHQWDHSYRPHRVTGLNKAVTDPLSDERLLWVDYSYW